MNPGNLDQRSRQPVTANEFRITRDTWRESNWKNTVDSMVAMTSAASMAGKPRLVHMADIIALRVLSDRDAARIWAIDLTIAPLPPNLAQNTTTHFRGLISTPVVPGC